MTRTLLTSRLLALFIPALIGAAPPPPAGIAPYIHDGRFEPGDYAWLRGGFDAANAAEIAAYKGMVDWRSRCRTSDMAETRSELAGLGVRVGATLDTIPYRSLVCDQVASLPEPLDVHDWAGFMRDVSVVRPIMQGFLAAVVMGERASVIDSTDMRDALNARGAGEQTLRAGLAWMNGSHTDGPTLSLTSQQRGILTSEFAIALAARDHANTDWLKRMVVSQGWPMRSQVGDSAAKTAWLLVQHADADPAFQIRALRLIEPLVTTGEASSRNYAYLYDRVMLKVVGKQRYGTQLDCQKGRLNPMTLEDEAEVDARRRQVGMGPLSAYVDEARQEAGACTDGA